MSEAEHEDELAEDELAEEPPHVSVLAEPVLRLLGEAAALSELDEPWFLDGTLGAGGHAASLLQALPQARLLGVDRDPSALELARARLSEAGVLERARLEHATYAVAPALLERIELPPLAGALLDLGISSMQVDQAERGFAFRYDGPLDMRMDPTSEGPTAADLIAELPETELADLIYQLGEERRSRRIARAIVEERKRAPIRRTGELADLIERVVPRGRPRRTKRGRPKRGIHPATRTFQALRLAVNDELGQLDRALPALWERLAVGGRLAVISFHSLEDRRVKHFFRAEKQAKRARVLTKKPLTAADEELALNPRSRSAKLRVAERLA